MPVDRQRLGAGAVVIVAALAAVCGQLLAPATVSRPDYADAARALVAGDRDLVIRAPWGYTVPSGYLGAVALSSYMAPGSDPAVGRLPALHVAQFLLHVVSALVTYGLLLTFGARVPWAAIGGLGVALHPILVLNVNRIEDNNFAVPLLLGLSGIYLQVSRRGCNVRLVLLAGVVAGLGLAFRPVLVLRGCPSSC